jgi:hypothetical protein
MVKGIDIFMEHFKGYEDCYILIGGAASDLWLGKSGLSFRATKDLDIVLIVDRLNLNFFECFWKFVKEAGYGDIQQSAQNHNFYRFLDPDKGEYPFMIELLSRNLLDLPGDVHLTPIPSGGDISSLSAILLNDVYYDYIVNSRIVINGVSSIPPCCIIPLKARAFLDLSKRKSDGERVKSSDIKKHRNDIFRLYLALVPSDHFELPDQIHHDMTDFLKCFPAESKDWNAIKAAVGAPGLPKATEVLIQIKSIFNL